MQGGRILIIDDDDELCQELAESLNCEGYRTNYTSDPLKGKELVGDDCYDTIIVDYKMPALTGIDILKRMRADKITKRVFIITGRPFIAQVLREENLAGMVSGVISKPIHFDAMLAMLKGPPQTPNRC